MTSTSPSLSLRSLDLSPSPDLHPLYPTPSQITNALTIHSGLSSVQKSQLMAHCASRACVFGDLALLQHILYDPRAQNFLDLNIRDEDGLGLISLAIHGFGVDGDRDVEREECVRLLVNQGALIFPDNAGWTPLHYAALLSPPTLISFLMTHGCSVFALTKRNLTPLHIVTAHSTLPGREDVALLLEESMRSQGWEGGKIDQRRRMVEQQQKRRGKQMQLRQDVATLLGVHSSWWGQESTSPAPDEDEGEDEDGDVDNDDPDNYAIYTPPLDYSSMLVFSPASLPQILESLVTNYPASIKDATPANSLYMLTRFACLACDHTWLEDLILSASDTIEEAFFNHAEDLTCLTFWLYNTTLWLHFIRCDNAINRTCEFMGTFELIEEVINSVYVFVIRFAERRIDQLLESTLLDFSVASSLDSVEFESDWSIFRPFSRNKKATRKSATHEVGRPRRTSTAPTTPIRNHTKAPTTNVVTGPKFASLRHSNKGSGTPLSSVFGEDGLQSPSPEDMLDFLTALHSFLVMSDINPALITQLWSQVFYWTACEIFNRIITRKKYLCRSRAVQINMTLRALEDWIAEAGLPAGIQSHLAPVRDLLNWVQCLSSINDFADLVSTIQSMRGINPLQMRRAVRDYKYEVNEDHMTEENIQYLTQLQKDWERHRVKMGVEAMRKEINERDHDRESLSSLQNEADQSMSSVTSTSTVSDSLNPRINIDILFDKTKDTSRWEPIKPPQPLGELLDSRYMIPLLFPSDPRMLAALPRKLANSDTKSIESQVSSSLLSQQEGGNDGIMAWRCCNRKIRDVGVGALQRIDGAVSAARWGKAVDPRFTDDDEEEQVGNDSDMSFGSAKKKKLRLSLSEYDLRKAGEGEEPLRVQTTHLTPISRKPSTHTGGRKGRTSLDSTPVD
ncbi:hypothetical protein AGABI1DRAFT_117026 [Agaricus bisporus var. burnettii JB137-S8]|uniref:Dilute domain-containing protein n=1 Tax=Agaricus bisporus var. burnettii (strain JB137-S8 / ATCC MYA-4627 / FGSC 10392) TaxID=597362 RepID=K5XJI0_AGABU|nr:uncharacterized protein AGABI1DRAFT_117026 [Agaricus bisporus var. burnettii JB137-S8]EKM83522.1 hypothetical protein AGABI1DRAFT_117026 [Agaricus bisporus var. burnettii JB137-S8]